MPGIQDHIGRKNNPLVIILMILTGAFLFVVLFFGGELGLIGLLGLFGAGALVFVAYRYPSIMIFLWMFSTQIMVELIVWDYDNYFEPSLSIGGGIDMLYGDPILFAIIAALFVKLFVGDRRAKGHSF